MPNPVAVLIEPDEGGREQPERWARRPNSAQAPALRSRIVLLAGEGLKNTEIAERLCVAHASVRKWRNRFAEHGLDGLADEPRPGRPRTVTDDKVEEVIVKTLETTPKDARTGRRARWAKRSASRSRRCHGSSGRSACNRTARRRGNSPETR